MPKQKKLDLVSADDWIALYINGLKVAEGHSLDEKQVIEALGLNVTCTYVESPKDIEGEVDFDPQLSSVRFIAFEEIDVDY